MKSITQRIRYGLAAAALFGSAAAASEPVPRTIEACVIGGVLTGSRYTYKLHVLAPAGRRALALDAFEGMTLRVRGYLLPGDNLTLRSLEIVAETCTLPRR